MFNGLAKYSDLALLISRIGIGAAYAFIHGLPKYEGGPERWAGVGKSVSYFGISFLPEFWGFLAMLAEFTGGILILIGLFIRPAAALIIIIMIVAFSSTLFSGSGIYKAAYPLEMAFFLILYVFIGAGKYSLDYKLSHKKSSY